jgi:hypothetical protein
LIPITHPKASPFSSYVFSDIHTVKLIAGGFVLDEFSASSNDPYLLGAQLRWDATWNNKWSSTLGIASISMESAVMLTNNVIPNVNRGNSRNIDGSLTYKFNPVVVDGAVTYTASSFPFYTGPFPIKIGGEC